MIQGGGFTPDMKQKERRGPVENEAGMASKGGLKNAVGTIAMARTPDPNSATAQFFINVKENAFLATATVSPGNRLHGVRPRGQGMNVVTQISRGRPPGRNEWDVPKLRSSSNRHVKPEK